MSAHSSKLGPPPPHPLSQKVSVPPTPGTGGGAHSPMGEGVGPRSDDWRKSLALCLLCREGGRVHGGDSESVREGCTQLCTPHSLIRQNLNFSLILSGKKAPFNFAIQNNSSCSAKEPYWYDLQSFTLRYEVEKAIQSNFHMRFDNKNIFRIKRCTISFIPNLFKYNKYNKCIILI